MNKVRRPRNAKREKYPDIRSWREELASLIRSRIDGEAVVIASPDHPLLIDGPDLLVGSPGSLLALFIPSAIESGQIRRFENRIKLARAALPAHAVFAGVHGRGTSGLLLETIPGLEFYSDQVDHVDPPSGKVVSTIISLCSARREPKPREMDAQDVVFRRFAKLLQANRITKKVRPARPIDKMKLTQSEVGSMEAGLRYVKFAGRTHFGSSARSAIHSTTQPDWLKIDGDYIEPADARLALLVSDQISSLDHDPDKYSRSLAFAGWLAVDEAEDLRVVGMAQKAVLGA